MLDDGSIELELYDHSEEAQQWLGNDVAWIYTIDAADVPQLRRMRGAADDRELLEGFARDFAHIHAIRDWLRHRGIPVTEKFDSWA